MSPPAIGVWKWMRQLIASDAATSEMASTRPLLGSTKWLQVGKSEPSEPAFHAVQHFQRCDTKTTIVSPAPIRCVTRPLIVLAMRSLMVVASTTVFKVPPLASKKRETRSADKWPPSSQQRTTAWSCSSSLPPQRDAGGSGQPSRGVRVVQ